MTLQKMIENNICMTVKPAQDELGGSAVITTTVKAAVNYMKHRGVGREYENDVDVLDDFIKTFKAEPINVFNGLLTVDYSGVCIWPVSVKLAPNYHDDMPFEWYDADCEVRGTSIPYPVALLLTSEQLLSDAKAAPVKFIMTTIDNEVPINEQV